MNRKTPNLLLLLLALALAECTRTTPREAEEIAETTGGPDIADLPAIDEQPQAGMGWCCDCERYIGNALVCTPSSANACSGDGFAWCLLDEAGDTWACAAECEAARPDGWCCDCEAPVAEYPGFECWPTDADACSYVWCERNKPGIVPASCTSVCNKPTVCCLCGTKSCWSSDGPDCTDPGEQWCRLDASNNPTACWAACE